MKCFVYVLLHVRRLGKQCDGLVLQVKLKRWKYSNLLPRGGSCAFHMLRPKGTTAVLVPSVQPCWSPSWCLFLRHDIAAHPYATATVLRFDAAVAPYCGKALFWPHSASQGNNCSTCFFRAALLGRLHGVCFCGMT